MGDFNPANGLIRNAWETTEGVATWAGWHYHDFVSESLSSAAETILPRSITTNSQQPVGSPSKIAVGGAIEVDWNAEGHLHYLANLQGAYSTSTLTAGVEELILGPSQTTPVTPSMTVEVWRDDDMAQILRACRAREVSFNLGLRQFAQGSIQLLGTRADYWTEPAQTAGTSTDPQLRGLPNHTDWTVADGDLYLKITTATGGPPPTVVKGKFKLGSAASYGSIETTMTAGDWVVALDSTTGVRYGDKGLPVECYFANFTGIATNDEWKFDRERAVWVPVMPDVIPFNEIYAEISIDGGSPERVNSLSLTVTRPVEAIYAIGKRFAWLVRERGRRAVTGTFQREYLDTNLRKKLERAKEFYLLVNMTNGVTIGATAYEHTMELIAPKCMMSGNTPTIGGQDQMDENPSFTCHPEPTDPDGYVDDINIRIVSSIANPNS